MRKYILAAAAIIICLTFSVTDANAIIGLKKSLDKLPSATAMATGGSTKAPYAHAALCRKNGEACRGGGSSRVKLTTARWNTLKSVNNNINRSIRSRSDRSTHGRSDVWTVGGKFGDCEDFALAKRQLLMDKGIPGSAISVAVVRTRGGIGHAVLVVRTDHGDFVLDNRRHSILGWNRTGYRYYKITAPRNPRSWISVRGSRKI